MGGYLYPISVLNGIDTTNVIASSFGTSPITYIATKNCYAVIYNDSSHQIYASIDNTIITRNYDDATPTQVLIPLVAGQLLTITCLGQTGSYNCGYTIYGVKQY